MTIEHDKLDTHYRQQLSALMDGELSPDQARFLLRRLQHDQELTACWERWQWCGDALRGQAPARAAVGFAANVAQAVANEAGAAAPGNAVNAASGPLRGRVARWGSGALAASVALLALFMVRQQAPQDEPAAPALAAASRPASSVDSNLSRNGSVANGADNTSTMAEASVAMAAAVSRRGDATSRRSATRTQQAARSTAAARVMREPLRAVASAPALLTLPSTPATAPSARADTTAVTGLAANRSNPFSDPLPSTGAMQQQARPWPRSTLRPYSGGGAFNAGFSRDADARTFYPFDPLLVPAAPHSSTP